MGALRATSSRLPSPLVMVLAAVGLAVSIGGAYLFGRVADRNARSRLRTAALRLSAVVSREMAGCEDLLTSLHAYLQRGEPTAAEFDAFAGRLLRRREYIDALFWMPRVQPDELDAFVARVREAGQSDFEITGPPSSSRSPEDPHYPILFVVPRDGNEDMIGFDLAALPGHSADFRERARSGALTVTARIPMETDDRGALIGASLAVYDSPFIEDDPDRREAELTGFVGARLRATDLLESAVRQEPDGPLLVTELRDLDKPDQPPLATLGVAADDVVESHDAIVPVSGRRWQLRCRPRTREAFERSDPRAMLMLLCGLTITGVLVVWVSVVESRAERNARRVRERTQALDRAHASLQRSERDARRAFEHLRMIAEAAPALIVYVDRDGRYGFTNRAYRDWVAPGTDSVEGLRVKDVLPPEVYEQIPMARILALTGEEFAFELDVPHPEKGMRRLSARYVPDVGEDGGVVGFIAVIHDITDLRDAEERMRAARDAALEATRLKSEFVSTVTHELRTPLNAVVGGADLLLGTRLDPQQNEYASVIRSSATTLRAIVDDVLDFARLESDHLQLDELPFDPRQLLDDLLQVTGPSARQKGIELTSGEVDPIPARVLTDPHRVRQILLNLVGNAVKFTDAGGVHVDLSFHADGEAAGLLEIAVRDTGIGMSEQQSARAFQPFEQADGSTSRRFGGSGLGLAITHRLVGLLRGEISLTSERGRGTTVRVTLPVGVVEPATGPDAPAADAQSVVVVDAFDRSRDMLVAGLSRRSVHVKAFASVDDAVSAEIGTPDVVLVDIDVAARLDSDDLRRLADALRPARLLGLTSRPAPPAQAAVRESGLDDVLLEPVSESRLDAVVRTTPAPTVEIAFPAVRPGGRVLVVEDSPVNRLVAERMLERLGQTAELVTNGADAIVACGRTRYDLVLMDWHMPGMDGLEATRNIRAAESAAGDRVPIVAMTASYGAASRQACLEAGMDGFLDKPVRLATLAATVAKWVGGAAATDAPASIN